jgi:acylphosphatase
MADSSVRAHLLIRGRVQGVFFRQSLRAQAKRFKVRGWTRNLDDGSVEAMLEGKRENVEAVVHWARMGPAGARVDSVDLRWEAAGPISAVEGFEIR